MKKNLLIVGVVIVVIAIGSVIIFSTRNKSTISSKSSSTSTAPVVISASTANVTIQNFAFSPKSISIKAGTTVTWTNKDPVGHTVTADTPSAFAPDSTLIEQNQTYSFKFTQAGTYPIHCSVHPNMTATVIVTD